MMSAADRLQAIRIVLVAPSHPGNVGGAARAMLTMGLGRLVLVRPRRFPDQEAIALASGATAVLDRAQVVATLDAALAGCVAAVGFRRGRVNSRASAGRA
jgi:tRNA C32,U32 (ribose-2'-O)-methylase TrmJ